jgi:hypothetical protein
MDWFCVTGRHILPHNVKVELCFQNFFQINYKWIADMPWDNKYSTPLLWQSLNKFRIQNVLIKSWVAWTLCTIILFHMIFEWTPHFCTQDILSVRSLSWAVNLVTLYLTQLVIACHNRITTLSWQIFTPVVTYIELLYGWLWHLQESQNLLNLPR